MANRVDFTAIAGALYALARILENPAVSLALTDFRDDFVATARQIKVLGDYKELHDALHEVQFRCYNMVEPQATRSPHSRDDIDESLFEYKFTLERSLARFQKVTATGTVATTCNCSAELAKADNFFQQALDGQDGALAECCRSLKRVLYGYPSRINTELYSAANQVRIDPIVRALEKAVSTSLGAAVDTPLDIADLEAGRAQLAELNKYLICLTNDHNGWQELDLELRRVASDLPGDPKELSDSWPGLKQASEALLCSADEESVARLHVAIAELDTALADGIAERLRPLFKVYRRYADERFYQIDVELKELCEELRGLEPPLAVLLARFVVGRSPSSERQSTLQPATTTATQISHLRRQAKELKNVYGWLSRRIDALDNDIALEMDSERCLVKTERADLLRARRQRIVDKLETIDAQLRRRGGPEDQSPPAD